MQHLNQINISVWNSIDQIAKVKKLSLPRLALSAGLDQSTFSHARRKRNWLSLQTLAKVLHANSISLEDWVKMVSASKRTPNRPKITAAKRPPVRRQPVIRLSQTAKQRIRERLGKET